MVYNNFCLSERQIQVCRDNVLARYIRRKTFDFQDKRESMHFFCKYGYYMLIKIYEEAIRMVASFFGYSFCL